MRKSLVSTSRFLSRVLRHAPESIGLVLDAQGWASVDDLLHRARAAGRPMTLELLREVVETNDKKRYGRFVRPAVNQSGAWPSRARGRRDGSCSHR